MRGRFVITVIAALAAGVLAYLVSHHMVCRRGVGGAFDGTLDLSSLVDTLGLSFDQRQQLEALRADYAVRLFERCKTSCRTRRRLAAALADDQADGEDLDEIVIEMCRAYEAMERDTLAHLRDVRGILTPAQKIAFDALMDRCSCRSCNEKVPAACCPGHGEKNK